jgi:hypothetical protein
MTTPLDVTVAYHIPLYQLYRLNTRRGVTDDDNDAQVKNMLTNVFHAVVGDMQYNVNLVRYDLDTEDGVVYFFIDPATKQRITDQASLIIMTHLYPVSDQKALLLDRHGRFINWEAQHAFLCTQSLVLFVTERKFDMTVADFVGSAYITRYQPQTFAVLQIKNMGQPPDLSFDKNTKVNTQAITTIRGAIMDAYPQLKPIPPDEAQLKTQKHSWTVIWIILLLAAGLGGLLLYLVMKR